MLSSGAMALALLAVSATQCMKCVMFEIHSATSYCDFYVRPQVKNVHLEMQLRPRANRRGGKKKTSLQLTNNIYENRAG